MIKAKGPGDVVLSSSQPIDISFAGIPVIAVDWGQSPDSSAVLLLGPKGRVEGIHVQRQTPPAEPSKPEYLFCPTCGIDVLTNRAAKITGQLLQGQTLTEIEVSCDCGCTVEVPLSEYFRLLLTQQSLWP